MREISINDIEGIRIGQAEDIEGGTGCTVLICEGGMAAGVDVRGGGPASRDSRTLDPLSCAQSIHALLFSGGSAFSLDAAGGVMRYLEERGVGYDTGVARVPIVCQSALFDLGVGNVRARPDAEMAYRACVAAEAGNYRDGCFGAGTGATVGKLYGLNRCMKSGIGAYAVQLGEVKLGAIAAVNAFGDIFDARSGQQLAGLLTEDHTGLCDTAALMYENLRISENKFTGNTTLGAVFTNAGFDKVRLTKIAAMAQNGLARAIHPVHTSADGDSVYALSVGNVPADMDMIGTLAADALTVAIKRAVLNAEGMYGRPAARDLRAVLPNEEI